VFVSMSEVGLGHLKLRFLRSRGVGNPQSAAPMDTENVEIAYKSTTGMVIHEPKTQTNGRHWSPTQGRQVIYLRHSRVVM